MGEISEMMLDGTLCKECGGYIHTEPQGVPRLCRSCRKVKNHKYRKKKTQ